MRFYSISFIEDENPFALKCLDSDKALLLCEDINKRKSIQKGCFFYLFLKELFI